MHAHLLAHAPLLLAFTVSGCLGVTLSTRFHATCRWIHFSVHAALIYFSCRVTIEEPDALQAGQPYVVGKAQLSPVSLIRLCTSFETASDLVTAICPCRFVILYNTRTLDDCCPAHHMCSVLQSIRSLHLQVLLAPCSARCLFVDLHMHMNHHMCLGGCSHIHPALRRLTLT